MEDLKDQMQSNFLQYASYVILDRAIPNVVDGLKPVQRRILYTLHKIDDGKLHKVANVAGQTMALHPHGDAPITEALVNLANKNYLLDRQGNFGNLYTGDPSAAARYIETRLSHLAKETLFNNEITEFIPSYDGRNDEPTALPAKIPILLMQGVEGIAVGMSTRILPHNFQELLEAEIAHLEGKSFTLYPDFPTGGIMDASDYNKGLGKVKLRAKLSVPDDKTVMISDICFGTTTESLIQSIDEAAKKGKIKIDSIYDFTSDKVEIEIKLPRGQHADQLIDALYAFTECEVSLSSQLIVIKDNLPWQTNVHEILKLNADLLVTYIQRELEIALAKINEKIFYRSLERLFISHRLYKKIEEVDTGEKIHTTIASSLKPFHDQLLRIPTPEDREKLLNIPIRRISLFDINKCEEDLIVMQKEVARIEKDLKQVKKVSIAYLKTLLTKYGKEFPRKTEIQTIGTVDVKAISTKKVKIFIDLTAGFIGTKVQSALSFECTNFDKLLLIFEDGSYTVTSIDEKKYIYQNSSTLVFAGPADKKTVFSVVYEDKKHLYAKRFVVEKFILDKTYRYIDESAKLRHLTNIEGGIQVDVELKPQPKQRTHHLVFKMQDVLVKGVTAKGVRITDKPAKAVSLNVASGTTCIGTAT